MEKTGSTAIFEFSKLLFDERGNWLEVQKAPAADLLTETRLAICDGLREIGKSGDIALILETEKTILTNDLVLYANSAAMKGSLKAGLDELTAAQALLPKVADPDLYKAVDETLSLPKNRVGGVPRDQARQFFRSHDSRLVNMDKSRLDDVEKSIIDERKRNIRSAEKIYVEAQKKALGIAPAASQDRGQGMSL
jgi:hypothetical protein